MFLKADHVENENTPDMLTPSDDKCVVRHHWMFYSVCCYVLYATRVV